MRPSLLMLTPVLLMFAASPSAIAAPAAHALELRSYNLKPGRRADFHRLVEREALPLLRRAEIDVVAYGPSLHDADSYFLMRTFSSLDDRQRVEDAFYGSAEWRNGPRDAVLAHIVSYTTIVVSVDDATLGGLRQIMPAPHATASDLDTLLALNDDYVRSVQHSDVVRFDQILADDFVAILSDGSIYDRAGFLIHTAAPVAITNIRAHDVNVRVMGDFAVIHARTTFTFADGRPGAGRYTDVWARRNGRWVAVAAHVTRT